MMKQWAKGWVLVDVFQNDYVASLYFERGKESLLLRNRYEPTIGAFYVHNNGKRKEKHQYNLGADRVDWLVGKAREHGVI